MNQSNVVNVVNLENQSQLNCDVVVIGSGAGGAIAAKNLSAAGLDVIILEHGPYKRTQDFKGLESIAYPDLYQDAAGRKTKDKAISILQGRTVGGSTTVNWTTSIRTPANTLAHWQQEHGLKNLTSKELLPWFEKVEQALNIETWSMPPNENNHVLQRGCEALGWEFTVIRRNVKHCANLGYCGMGCPINAKQSMLVTAIPEAIANGAKLIHSAFANRLLLSNEVVNGVEVFACDDRHQPNFSHKIRINAKHIVLSAGAIGSPGVMLRSNVPDPNGNIGKRTFLHPSVISGALLKEPVAAHAGAPQSIYSDQFVWPQEGMGFKLETPPVHPILLGSKLFQFGQEHFELMGQFNHLQATIALMRDGFSEESPGGRVQLDDYERPVLDYPVNDSLLAGMRQALLAMAELQFAAGARSVMPLHQSARMYTSWKEAKDAIDELTMTPHGVRIASAHVMGGLAMGQDIESSCVDEYGRYHHLQNLHVFDGSVFPTSLGANPQLTIYGLTERNSNKLTEQLKVST